MTLANYSMIFILFGVLSIGCGEKKSPAPIPAQTDAAAADADPIGDDTFAEDPEVDDELGGVVDDDYGDVIPDDVVDDVDGFDPNDIPADDAGGGFNIGDAMGLIGPLMGAMQGGDPTAAIGPILETMGKAGGMGGGMGQIAQLLPALSGLFGGGAQ